MDSASITNNSIDIVDSTYKIKRSYAHITEEAMERLIQYAIQGHMSLYLNNELTGTLARNIAIEAASSLADILKNYVCYEKTDDKEE